MADDAVEVEAAGRTVRVSSPDKLYFRKADATKLDLVHYYKAVAEPLMATLQDRPLLLERHPNGSSGKSFFQKRIPKSAPEWLTTTEVQTVNGTPSDVLVATDIAHVLWAVNLGCLGFHVWPVRARDVEVADELRIDLDPSPGTDFDDVRWAAARTRELFDELGVASFPKTTGKAGIHVYVALTPDQDSYAVRAPRSPSPGSSSAGTPSASPRSGGRRSGGSGSSSTTTRTPRTRPSSAHGACGPGPPHRSRRRSTGTTWSGSTRPT